MPLLKRPGKPALHYVQDDYTDSWKNAGTILLQHGYAVEWHEYPMPHSVCIEEIGHIGAWLRHALTQ